MTTQRTFCAAQSSTADAAAVVVDYCEVCYADHVKVSRSFRVDAHSSAKMIDGGRPLAPEILDQTDRVGAKSPIFDLCSLVETQP